MTPSDEATNTVGDARQYTVENPVDGADHTIELFAADNVSQTDATVMFEASGDDADRGTSDAVITVTNGITTGDTDGSVTAQSSGGVITFTIESDTAESVVPVVYFDDDASTTLTVDADGLPVAAEPFGIGGQKNWLPEEVAAGTDALGDVVQVDTAGNWYTLDTDQNGSAADVLVNYEDGDSFTYSSNSSGVVLTTAEFEEFLSVGDTIDVTGYNPGGAAFGAATIHDMTNDIPAAPANLTVTTSGTGDVDDTVHLDWDAPSNPDLDDNGYTVYRVDEDGNEDTYDSNNLNGSSFEDAAGDPADTEWTQTVANPGDYVYYVTASNTGNDEGPASNQVTVIIDEEILGDLTSDNAIAVGGDVLVGEAQNGDTWEIGFNGELKSDVDTDVETEGRIVVVDGAGNTAIVGVNDGNATFSLNDDPKVFAGQTYNEGELLQVTLTADLEDDSNAQFVGDVEALSYPLTITDSQNVVADDADVDGAWDVASSADTTLELDTDAGSDDVTVTVVADPDTLTNGGGETSTITGLPH